MVFTTVFFICEGQPSFQMSLQLIKSTQTCLILIKFLYSSSMTTPTVPYWGVSGYQSEYSDIILVLTCTWECPEPASLPRLPSTDFWRYPNSLVCGPCNAQETVKTYYNFCSSNIAHSHLLGRLQPFSPALHLGQR